MFSKPAKFGLCNAIIFASVFLFSGCAGLFEDAPQNTADVYYADFPDVPIPAEMSLRSGNSQVIKTANTVNGYLEFTGSVSWDSLVNACASNLTRDGWNVLGLFRGSNSVIIADKMDRTCVMTIYDGFPSTTLHVWVADKINGFIAPLAAPERVNNDGTETYLTTGTGTSSGSGGLNEQGLTE